jgi:hypothetical protein
MYAHIHTYMVPGTYFQSTNYGYMNSHIHTKESDTCLDGRKPGHTKGGLKLRKLSDNFAARDWRITSSRTYVCMYHMYACVNWVKYLKDWEGAQRHTWPVRHACIHCGICVQYFMAGDWRITSSKKCIYVCVYAGLAARNRRITSSGSYVYYVCVYVYVYIYIYIYIVYITYTCIYYTHKDHTYLVAHILTQTYTYIHVSTRIYHKRVHIHAA